MLATASRPSHLAPPPAPLDDWFDQLRGQGSRIVDLTRNPARSCRLDELVAQAEADAQTWLRLGVRPGTPVMLSCGTNLTFIRQLLALLKIGAVPVPTSHLLPAAACEEVMALVQPGAIVTLPARRRLFRPAEEVQAPFGDGHSVLLDRRNLKPRSELANCLVILSSGSTGTPKAVVHSIERVLLNARLHASAVDYEPGGRLLLALQAFFSYGLVAGILASLQSGKDVFICEQPFSAANWRAVCEAERITLFASTPFMLRQLLDVGQPFPATLRKITIGGDRILPGDLDALRALYRGRIYLTYGLSEAGPRVFTNLIGDDPAGWTAAGRPLDGVEIKLHQPERCDGKEVGELLVRTPTAMLGYLSGRELIRDDFLDGWLRTHDIFIHDPAVGDYRFLERRKNVIVSGGEKLAAGYIQKMLMLHPAIAKAVVRSRPDPRLGEVPVAVVQLAADAPDIRGADLAVWCRQRLRLNEIPCEFHFTDDLHVVNK